MRRLVVPALSIDRVRTKHLQLSAVDFGREHPNHAAVFILEKSSHRSGEDEYGRACLPEHQHFHLPMEFLAVPLVIFAIHEPKYLTLTAILEPGLWRVPAFALGRRKDSCRRFAFS